MRTYLTILTFIALSLQFGWSQRRQMAPMPLDPYMFGIKGIYNHAEVQGGFGASLSYPASNFINVLAEATLYPSLTNNKFTEYSYEFSGMFKFYRTRSLATFSLLAGVNKNAWKQGIISMNDQSFQSWQKSESFMLGLHYCYPMSRYVNLTVEHKVYLNYFVQTTAVGINFPIYYGAAPKDARVKQKFKKNQGKKFHKKKNKLRLNKGRGNV